MSQIGQMFRLFSEDLDALGSALLIGVALLSMWLGYRYSRPTRSSPMAFRVDAVSRSDARIALLNDLTELEDAVRAHTKELVWLSAMALLGGILFFSLSLVVGGIAGGAAAWAMRNRQLVSVAASTVVAVVSITLHAFVRSATPWDASRWLDLALCIALIVDLGVATWALVRYRKADAAFHRRANRVDTNNFANKSKSVI
jgi:hypothetical protein